MTFTLTKDCANKLVKVENTSVVVIPTGVFSIGDAVILFNNSDNYICLQSKVANSYQSCRPKSRENFEFPPRSLLNGVFVDGDTVVISVGL